MARDAAKHARTIGVFVRIMILSRSTMRGAWRSLVRWLSPMETLAVVGCASCAVFRIPHGADGAAPRWGLSSAGAPCTIASWGRGGDRADLYGTVASCEAVLRC